MVLIFIIDLHIFKIGFTSCKNVLLIQGIGLQRKNRANKEKHKEKLTKQDIKKQCLLNLDCNLVESMKRKTQAKNRVLFCKKRNWWHRHHCNN